MQNDIRGAGGGGGGKGGQSSGSSRAPIESPDSLRSRQYARVVDALSEGEIEGLVNGLKSVFLDGAPIQNSDDTYNFSGVVLVSRSGTQSQNYIPGFSAVESEVAVNTEVTNASPVVRSISNTDVDAVRVTLTIPRLTYQDTTTGDMTGTTVQIAIDVQDNGGGYVEKVADTISGKTTSQYQRSYRIELTGTGPWDIRMRRVTADSGAGNLQNETFWGSYTEIIDSKLAYPNTAIQALQVDAEQFRAIPRRGYLVKGLKVKIPDNYDPDTRIYTGTWGGSFVTAWTDNPAWCFYDMLTNERYGLGSLIDATQVDKWSLYAIGQYCDELVDDGFGGTEPRFTCNLYLQTREEAFKVLQSMASIFCGMLYWAGGALTAVQDAPSDAVALYTPSNVVDGVFHYEGSSSRARHTVALVAWNDPDDHYRQKVEYVEDREGILRYGVQQTEVIALGCSSRGQAHRYGRRILFSERLETETVTFHVGLEGAVVFPGAVIKTSDPVRAGVRFGGRIVSASLLSGNHRVILDDDVVIEAGKTYTLFVVLPDGTVESGTVVTGAGTYSYLDVNPVFSTLPTGESVWVLAANDLVPETWRVVSVAEGDGDGDTTYEILAVQHYPEKYDVIENDILLDVLPTSTLGGRPDLPTGLDMEEVLYQNGVEVKSMIQVSWDYLPGLQWIFSWRRDAGNWTHKEIDTSSETIYDVIAGTYDVRVIAVNPVTKVRSQIATDSLVAAGALASPDDVTGLALEVPWVGKDCRIRWTANPRVSHYEIDVYSNGSPPLLQATYSVSDTRFTYSFEQNSEDGGPWRDLIFEVFAVVDGVRSGTPASIAAYNPQIGAPSGISITAGAGAVLISLNRPTESDYVGTLVWMSETSGFTPGAGNLIYDGPSTKLISAMGLSGGVEQFVRIAHYDIFGQDDLTLSTEGSATPVSASGIPIVTSLPAYGDEIGQVVSLASGDSPYTQDKLYRWDGSDWVSWVDGSDILASSVTTGKLAAQAVTAEKIATGTITADQIASNAITSVKILAGAVTAGKIDTDAITAAGGEIEDLTVGTLKIQDDAVTVPVGAYTGAVYTVSPYLSTGQTADMISATITTSGQPVMITASASIANTNVAASWDLLRDSTVIASMNNAHSPGIVSSDSITVQDTPSAGTYTYTWRVRSNSGLLYVSFGARGMTLLEVKK